MPIVETGALQAAGTQAGPETAGFNPAAFLGEEWASMGRMEKAGKLFGLGASATGALGDQPQAPPPIVSSDARPQQRPASQLPMSNDYLQLLARVKAKIKPARGVIGIR
jgi:hypothetical protein